MMESATRSVEFSFNNDVLTKGWSSKLMICSQAQLDSELDKIKAICIENGYPEDVILDCFCRKITSFSADKKYGPQKCPVYLEMQWIGNVSLQFEDQINKTITKCCCDAANPRLIFRTQKVLPSIQKDCMPTTQKSLVVYECSCECDARYIGCTSQRLADRVKQHVPTNIRNHIFWQREQFSPQI